MIKNAFAYITRKSLKSIIIMLVILAMSTLSLISLSKVTGDIAKQIARQSASSQLGGGAEAEGFNKTLSSLDINVLPKFIFYVVIFMSLVLLVSLIISSFNILRRNPKELLIDNK